MYVHTMKSPRLAEAYCDRMYEAGEAKVGRASRVLWSSHSSAESYDMYLTLIKASPSAWHIPPDLHTSAELL